jgi:gamma-glutamylcyclotransferase (GGCT)/AIG2-like uncharacterized protein YtfP
MPTLLFIYGTLHPDRAPAEIAAAARRLTPVGPATIRARLHNLGAYPGAILDPTAPPLPGELFVVPDDEVMARLDAYEDFRPADPANSLYLRVMTTATMPDGAAVTCSVYVYNREIPG